MRFTRHAKNKMRHARVDAAAVQRIIDQPDDQTTDAKGNHVLTATIDGRTVAIVIAGDDPNTVITVIQKR